MAARLQSIQGRMAAAARRAGRELAAIRLIAVSKTHPAATLAELAGLGQRRFGENRLQEAQGKQAELAGLDPPLEWHFIGHLQRNKVNAVVGRFSLIHSVDSPRLIEALEARAAALNTTQAILFELNLAGEASKTGAAPSALEPMLAALASAPHLRGAGLMIVPPYADDPEASRPYFSELRQLLGDIGPRSNFAPQELSMGMSHDFDVAIEEGATLVRIGTALFGERG